MEELGLFLIIFFIIFFFNFNIDSWHNRKWFLYFVIGLFIFSCAILVLLKIIKKKFLKTTIFNLTDDDEDVNYTLIFNTTSVGAIISLFFDVSSLDVMFAT